MNVPEEFADYMVTESHLSLEEQKERFDFMYLREIQERTKILRGLDFEKEEIKKRIKSYIDWAFDFMEPPSFYKSVDSVVEEIFRQPMSRCESY